MANAGEFPKVDGDIIYRDDYNLVRQAVENVLSGWWGSTFSAPPLAGNPTITAAGVQLLIDDINKAYTHTAISLHSWLSMIKPAEGAGSELLLPVMCV